MSDDVIAKQFTEIYFEWLDSNTMVTSPDGEVVTAGTCLRLNENIFFLKPLTVDQLKKLKTVVSEAVDHELIKRESKD